MGRVWVFVQVYISPMTVVFHVKNDSLSSFTEVFSELTSLHTPRITTLVYLSNIGSFFYENFPINILRNIGIFHTRTSHYLYLDSDMIPSSIN